MTGAVFAIPGDKDRRTGGFIYEATVLRTLNEIGCPTAHLALPDSFPTPTAQDIAETVRLLRQVPRGTPIILDGLVFGAIDPEGLSLVAAPVVAMIHHPLGLETGLSAERADFLRQNEAAALRHAHHVIVPSPETKRLLVAEFGAAAEGITIAPPGFRRPRVNRQTLDPPMILSVGLLAPRKGHDVLIDSLGLIKDVPWRAILVGKAHDPDYATSLRHQIARLNLGGRVDLVGEVHAQALERHFNAASLFALATRYEGYGMVLSEAMFYGLPVVTCRVGAVPDTVGDAAVLVESEDRAGLAAAMRMVLLDEKVAADFRTRALRFSARLPTWEETARIFAGVLGQVSGARA
ncbi:MAG: glycosyltransferase family 4 protein [Pseudomonadota bacterium]